MAAIPHSEQFDVLSFATISVAPTAPRNTPGVDDAGNRYIYTGTGWILTHANGAAVVSDSDYALGPIYDDGTWQYFGEAVPGSAVGAASWKVYRVNKTTGQTEYANGNSNATNVYIDAATVTGFPYS